ncbi:DNA (cytosine-5-)-methyltransferase [Gluconobacter wancherniae]|uniref:DNA (cytosine-5-)-methyltransferase n=1 Tax=Gluconobacter wancherniae TaxID=1307955 RepID=UPI001B8AD69E|nr:DNA (cytosine-5-)-methyltransferase [Gluconobacter wancherniae]MBS1064290.1 DNA (cytosine-5-)-methyltransferase [Gluconobacter wancherniae]
MSRSPKNSSSFSRLREQAGLTLKEAADQLGISETTASRYENGKLGVSAPVMKLLDKLIEERRQCRPSGNPGFRFIDLFAGIGGLRVGFESIGGHCVFTSEWDRFSKQTYALNYPDNHEISGDIRPFSEDPSLVPEHDVLLAGFPCQPFSLAGVSKKNSLGRPHGFLCDMQGTLFFDTARIIAHHRPAAFLLENVKNLQRHDKGRTFAVIMATLRDKLGYHVQARVISSAPWVPQKRERIFIVGFRRKTDFDLNKLEIPSIERGPKLGSILDPNESVDPKYTLTEHLWNYLQNYKAKHEAKGNGFGYGLFGPDDVARTLSARYHKDGSEILIRQDGKRPRRLTPQECARLMGFERPGRPFRIGVSDTQAYRQFGNAVVVPVIEHLAEAMAPYIRTVMQTPEDPERRKELSSASVEVPIG